MTSPDVSAQNLRTVGDRIEKLLDDLQACADARSFGLAEEVLRLVSELYGAGLVRVLELAREHAPGLIDVLVSDELVASLLLVHGLHPDSLAERVEGALQRVRPLLARHQGDVELLGIDDAAGAVRLRLLGSCDGCPSSSITLQLAVERAILEAAPEIVRVEVGAAPVPGVPIAITSKPTYEECPAEVGSA
jgi:Fe-S cluster biogenesis protein NfuA